MMNTPIVDVGAMVDAMIDRFGELGITEEDSEPDPGVIQP